MADPNQLLVKFRFGPFEVNVSTGELLKHGIRVRVPAQPFAILVLLLERSGELVTREQLREQIWGEGTFVDFEHGLNSAINKLRSALGDSAEDPRYIETMPGRGYRFIGTLEPAAVTPLIPLTPRGLSEVARPPRRRLAPWERLIWAVGSLACLALGLWLRSAESPRSNMNLTRITADAGLSQFPALSPDGNLIAYSSDRGLNGEQDLYVRQVAGGQPVRLTFDGAGNTMPDFSPDGLKVVFRSNRNGGGLYEIPALGGEARLLGPAGLNPKYSPDGSLVAYWMGSDTIDVAVPGAGAIWVVPVSGGAPRRIAADFSSARQPIWLADRDLLFVGYTSPRAYDRSAVDWWIVPTNNGAAVRTGVFDAFIHSGLRSESSVATPFMPRPGCWSSGANKVIFSLGIGDHADLWQIGISARTGKVNGAPERVTAGTLRELYPSCSRAGTLAFTAVETTRDVWSMGFDLDRGLPTSRRTLERITVGPALREFASIANDGGLLAFASNQSGPNNIWTKNLATGKESPLASSSAEQHYPVTSPSGAKIAFSVFEKDTRGVYVSAQGHPAEKVCTGCLRATDWSRDEKTILIFGGYPYQIDMLDLASHQRAPILKHPKYNLLYARFSPDNRWVSFTVRTGPNQGRIVVAPLDGLKPVAESAWVTVADTTAGDFANWSPDGRTLYFSSASDGHNCIWGQRIEALSHRPTGQPFAALHLHGRVYYQPAANWAGWSVGGGRIAMVLAEDTGNIWMMSRTSPR